MTLNVYEWQSYACNNSSDHRLVAEFESGAAATAMSKELGKVFLENAEQADEAIEEGGDWDPHDLEPSPALVAFAKKYGTKFTEGLVWGDDCMTEDLPEIATLGNRMYVYHGYMSGGFDGDLPGILKKAGAKKVQIESGPAWLKVTATAKGAVRRSALQSAIDGFVGQRKTKDNLCDWDTPWKGKLPIAKKLENVTLQHGEEATTFTIAIGADAIEDMTKWLKKAGAASVDIELVNDKDITALQKAEAKATKSAGSAAKPPPASFDPKGKTFLFTGKLASMTRSDAVARVAQIGGKVAGSVNKALDVLVIGDDGSPLYGDGAKGDKQVKAESLNAAGSKIQIISESAFLGLGKK